MSDCLRKLHTVIVPIVIIIFSLFSNAVVACGDDSTFSALTFNVQNLFDGEKNGNEYAEYTPVRWSDENYQRRLAAVGRALQTVSDGITILALQEVENEGVVLDLQKYYLPGLPHVVVSDNAHASTEVALLSKYKILSARTHQIGKNISHGTRAILNVYVKIPQLTHKSLQVMVVHLKSQRKTESKYSSRDVRSMQYRVLSNNIDPKHPTIILGDFNDIDPLSSIRAYISMMQDIPTVQVIEIPVTIDADTNITGTYLYKNNFQFIDHIMIDVVFNTYIQDSMIRVIAQPPFLTDDGCCPNKFVYHQKNYNAVSDHLPLAFTAFIQD